MGCRSYFLKATEEQRLQSSVNFGDRIIRQLLVDDMSKGIFKLAMVSYHSEKNVEMIGFSLLDGLFSSRPSSNLILD